MNAELGLKILPAVSICAAALAVFLPVIMARLKFKGSCQLILTNFFVAASMLAGAKFAFVLETGDLGTLYGGYASGAGFLAVLALSPLLRLTLPSSLPALRWADLVVPGVCLGLAAMRACCFLSGCCHGLPTDDGWAVQFPALSPAWIAHWRAGEVSIREPLSLPVHPLQLYFLAANLLLAFISIITIRARLREGSTFLIFVGGYGTSKFLLEMLRDPSLPLSAFGELGFGSMAIGLFFYLRGGGMKRSSCIAPI
jgi:phosphatidylglycerol:prolipoprotein diacylglycerol transferase